VLVDLLKFSWRRKSRLCNNIE